MNRKLLLLILVLLLVFAFGCKKEVDTDIDAPGSISESRADTTDGEAPTENASVDATENEGDNSIPIDRPDGDRDEETTSSEGTDTPEIGVRPNDEHNADNAWTTEATEPTVNTGGQTASEPEENTAATAPPENPAESDNVNSSDDFKDCTYEEYQNMSASAQQEFFAKFGSYEAFFEWYNQAKDEYEREHPDNIIDGGELDLSEIVGN